MRGERRENGKATPKGKGIKKDRYSLALLAL